LDHFQVPPFKHHAAYEVWHESNKKNWKLNEDPYLSSLELLSQANVDGGIGPRSCKIRLIEIGANNSYKTLALSIPATLRSWGSQIRELVLDSACEYSNSYVLI
jgi:hypothetical protein